MADISIDFHALPEELRDFVKQVVADFGLHTVAIQYAIRGASFEAIELVGDALEEPFSISSTHRRLHFTLEAPALPVNDELDFAKKNSATLRLDVGERTEAELRESWLSARTENADALAVWKKIAKRLKGLTEKGALAIQPDTGATGNARAHRYTAGAKALEDSGVAMLTINGIILKLGKTKENTTANQ